MKYLVFAVLLWSSAASQQCTTDFVETQVWPPFAIVQTAQEWAPDVTVASDEFSEHVAAVVRNATVSEERLEAVPQVLADLRLILKTRWPGSETVMIGSLVYGLAMTHSDVDCTVLLAQCTGVSRDLLDDAANALLQYPKKFTKLRPIFGVQVPAVSLTHAPTQFKLDLTINNYVAIQRTSALRYLLNLNDRVHNLAFMVKRWIVVRKLKIYMISYGYMLMVIFYLQQRSMMPSIASLQVYAEPYYDSEWNLGFCEIEYHTQNRIPLNLLLGGFFEYYADFDFDKYIVCPYAGYPIEKRMFASIDNIPDEFSLYVRNVQANVTAALSLESNVVIQDMFIHNKSFSKYVDSRPNSTFMTELQFAAEKFRENNSNFLDKILLEA